MADNTAKRTMMVDTQIRPSDVTKFPIIDAMLGVQRELFVPDALRDAAYMDGPVDLGGGRAMLEPRVLAKLLDALDVQGNELVMDLGSGLGYSAAIVARMAEAVIAVEEDADLAGEAEGQLAAAEADNVAVVTAPLTEGAPKHGPYDVILVGGGVGDLPGALVSQLKDGGRIGAIFMEGALGTAKVGYKQGDDVNWRYAFNATASVLPGFERETAFHL